LQKVEMLALRNITITPEIQAEYQRKYDLTKL